MTKACATLSVIAALILAAAALWLGGLNQDEGWYLYAARLVHEGQIPYRDFAFTQAPLLPVVYGALYGWWSPAGVLGARLLTLALGFAGIGFSLGTVRLLVPPERRARASVIVLLLLGCNLYHLYYLAIPKTYALASLFLQIGFFLIARTQSRPGLRWRAVQLALGGAALALAAGARISLGLGLAVVGFALLFAFRRYRWDFLWFGLGGAVALAIVYGPFLLDPAARQGLVAAQAYHTARGGGSVVLVIGSLSRLVRWYLPLFVLLGLAVQAVLVVRSVRMPVIVRLALFAFAGIFLLQLAAPCPYEDYQVPLMGLLAVAVTAILVARTEAARLDRLVLLTLGLAFASAFGSPLLERWTTNGQDRFWTRMKASSELAQLREVAAEIERLDPGGTTLFTQDLYLAIESGRKVPKGLEMGPFSMLSDEAWEQLLTTTDCPIAAISGYTFAIDPPVCNERDREIYSALLTSVFERYQVVKEYEHFGQNATWLNLMRLGKEVTE